MPGLDAAAIPLSVEGRENPSIKLLKEFRGPALLIPKEYGGLGAALPRDWQCCERSRAGRVPRHRIHDAQLLGGDARGVGSVWRVWAIHSEQPGRALDVSGVRFRRRAIGAKAARLDDEGAPQRGGGWLISGRPCDLTPSMDFDVRPGG